MDPLFDVLSLLKPRTYVTGGLAASYRNELNSGELSVLTEAGGQSGDRARIKERQPRASHRL